jgi:hypothetical protein
MSLKLFKIAATPEAATEIEAMRAALGFQTHAQLFEWAVGVSRAIVEAQDAGAVVQVVYKKRRWWLPFWRRKEVYFLDVSPE